MNVSPTTARTLICAMLLALFVFLLFPAGTAQAQTASAAPITGEIERLTLNSQTDPWSGGIIVVGGQNIIIPRNLLIDLPANRLTLESTMLIGLRTAPKRGNHRRSSPSIRPDQYFSSITKTTLAATMMKSVSFELPSPAMSSLLQITTHSSGRCVSK